MKPTPVRSEGACSTPLITAIPVFLRLTIGSLLLVSAWTKIQDPQAFAFAIREFKTFIPHGWEPVAAYAIIDCEFIAGVMLVLGTCTRGAAVLAAMLMIAFGAGIASVMARDLRVDCPCFGRIKLICDGAVGTCHLVRNGLIATGALVIAFMGHGGLGIDGFFRARSTRG